MKTARRASSQRGQREAELLYAMYAWRERGSDTQTALVVDLIVRVATLEGNTLPRDPSAMLHQDLLVQLSLLV